MSSDDGFAPEELSMLRSFFRDEASEGLERITSTLLQATAELNEEQLSDIMRTTHTIKGSAGTVALAGIAEFAHVLEDSFAHVRSGQIKWTATALDCFVETVDAFRAVVNVADTPDDLLNERLRQQLAILKSLERSAPGDDGSAPTAPAAKPPAPADSATPPVSSETKAETPVSDGTPQVYQGSDDSTRSIIAGGLTGPYSQPDNQRVLRVAPERVDRLMDSVGELVFDRTRIERRVQHLRSLSRELGGTRQKVRDEVATLASGSADASALQRLETALATQVTQLSRATASLLEETEALRRTSTTLQDGLTQIRMQTAGSLLHRLAPTLRGIARAAGKKIELTTAGEDTEFDKAVADQVMDPIVQLLRNAVAHGIESTEQRLASGKPAAGQIRIEARQETGLVVLTVSDDGLGIDPAALRARFVASGRWTQTRADMASDDAVLRSIFDAGVSTRDEADELAGRGVGLDAVRETIARLCGEIEMTSTPGKGTSFTMRLPVTMAVAQAMLFKIHGNVYALPNLHVLETVYVELDTSTDPPRPPATTVVHEEVLPLVCMQHVLGSQIRPDRTGLPAIVADYAGKRFAITCDKIVGPRQIVVKQLGPMLSPLALYSGATISGSGKVQLILDTAALIHLAYPGSQPIQSPAPGGTKSNASDVSGRALVADDSRAIREVMTRILARAGYIVDLAKDGAHAWTMFRELHYDILITDLEMPELDGFGLIERVRADDEKTPIIIVSSRATSANKKRARQLGVLTFVAKPVTRRKIIDALSRMN